MPREDESPEPVHTLNGTAVAVGRAIIALIENGQEQDGSVHATDYFAFIMALLRGFAT